MKTPKERHEYDRQFHRRMAERYRLEAADLEGKAKWLRDRASEQDQKSEQADVHLRRLEGTLDAP